MSEAEPPPPADLTAALIERPVARDRFDALSDGHRREYIRWIDEAKRPQTRARRIAKAIEMLLASHAGA